MGRTDREALSAGTRFYLDGDLSPRVAVITRGLGLDAVSAHEAGMAAARLARALQRWAKERRSVTSYGICWLSV